MKKLISTEKRCFYLTINQYLLFQLSFQNFKSDSFCVGGRHRSATTKIYSDITSKGSYVLIGYCSICNSNKLTTVSDNTIQAEGIGSFLKKLGRISAKVGKKLAAIVLKNPGRALKNTSITATAAASRSLEAALSDLVEVITFYQTGKGLFLGRFV